MLKIQFNLGHPGHEPTVGAYQYDAAGNRLALTETTSLDETTVTTYTYDAGIPPGKDPLLIKRRNPFPPPA
ncbi:MAG: hypothetical protein SXV54_11760 [Chloroflexota bacterium]|nr:hypothetical protein [Chloroflexota bacterium]